MLEKNLQDILNAGIGLLKASQENFRNAFVNIEKTFEDMKGRGSTDNSEAAQKIREVLENAIRSIKEISSQAESNFGTILSEAQKNYSQLLEQLKSLIGEARFNDLNDKLEELADYIKKTAGFSMDSQATGKASSDASKGAGKKTGGKKTAKSA